MNPYAALIIIVAILLLIVAWKGSQDTVISAILGRQFP